jgi:hypothetical protein
MNSPYRFKATESGFNVYHRSTLIGEILPSKEASGRHCFYLGCDDRRHPRTYRGKIKAAEALHSIHKLAVESKRKRWSLQKLIVIAWDERPRASESPE